MVCGVDVIPPGRRLSRSLNDDGCRCRIAVRSMTVVLVSPLRSAAVTTTSSMLLAELRIFRLHEVLSFIYNKVSVVS